MPIQVKINEHFAIRSNSKFPLMARGSRTGAIVAFTNQTTGIVIQPGNSGLRQFKEYNDLINIRSSGWEILQPGSVIQLSNV